MGMDYIDLRNRHRYYCPDCQEELHPESEEWSISKCKDEGQLCEYCSMIENANKEAMELSNAN